ncbi:MAG: ATP-binding cassette domain-containing protein [Deltaproteobacteria bacterium]|nr:ATP-binding cassette domain-containing protein [Deltaproteobacteria bacterium]
MGAPAQETYSAEQHQPAATEVAIRAQNLARELAGVQAVKNITFEARFGSIVGLLGPNGAGKTTTLRILAGLLAPSQGTVEICGLRLPENQSAIKRQVGFLTSGMRLYDAFSPIESMAYFGSLHELERSALKHRIAQLVQDFGMQAFARKPFGKLSAGEKQRATIANTLVHDPRILILDEITLSLDVHSSAFILDFVRRERALGKCVIFSTHIMSEAEYLCDEIALIHGGQIIDRGSPPELIARYRGANLTAAFLSAVEQSGKAGLAACSSGD